MKKYSIIGVLLFIITGVISYGLGHAFFTSGAANANNTFTASSAFPTATPTPTTVPTITPTPTPGATATPTPSGIQPGDVVINEINWAGSSKGTSDEWIELRNTTEHSIDISGWQITKWLTSSGGHESLMVTIPTGKSIAAGGLFLIADKSPGVGSALMITPDDTDSSVVLDNSNLQVKLYINNWNTGGLLVDAAGNKNAPLAGDHQTGNTKTFFSMERNVTPGDGTQAANWHTATTAVNLNSDSGQNKGTPDAIND